MSLILVATLSTNAFAARKDLRVFRSLLSIGMQSEQFMSQAHLGLDDIDCTYSYASERYACSLTDISANEGQGAKVELRGHRAYVLFNLLVKAGAPSDSGMGKTGVSAQSIRCTQSVEGVADGSEAERTSCDFNFGG